MNDFQNSPDTMGPNTIAYYEKRARAIRAAFVADCCRAMWAHPRLSTGLDARKMDLGSTAHARDTEQARG